jgi:hypothetical protein
MVSGILYVAYGINPTMWKMCYGPTYTVAPMIQYWCRGVPGWSGIAVHPGT